MSSDDSDNEESKADGENKVKPELLGEKYSGETVVAFDMDQRVKDGRLALLFRDPNKPPQIWFQDLSCSWFFIANTFTDYFRLMIMHLGLPHW